MAQQVNYVIKGQRGGLYLTDYNDLIRELNRVQPTLVKQMQKDYRKIAKPVQIAIKNKIPSVAPLSGFIPKTQPGRLTWGANYQNKSKPVKSVLIQTPSSRKAPRVFSKHKTDAFSVARLQVTNAAVVLADMAGRTRKDINKYSRTKPYDYSRSKTGKRTHKINNQGKIMIDRLGKTASRYVYKGVESSLPKAKAESKIVLEKAFIIINRRLMG